VTWRPLAVNHAAPVLGPAA